MPTYTAVGYDVWGGPPDEDEIQEAWEEYQQENADNDDAMTEEDFRENYLENHPAEYNVNNSFRLDSVDIPYDAPDRDIVARAEQVFRTHNLEIDGIGDGDMIEFQTEDDGAPVGRFETDYKCTERLHGRILAYFTYPLLAKDRLIALSQNPHNHDKFYFIFVEKDRARPYEAFAHDAFSLEELRESFRDKRHAPRLDPIGVIFEKSPWDPVIRAPQRAQYFELSLIREPATADVLALVLDWWEDHQETYPKPIDGTGMFAVEEYEL